MKHILDDLMYRYPALAPIRDSIHSAINEMLDCFLTGHKILICGNGGSASDAQHIVGELMKSFVLKRPVPRKMKKAFYDYGDIGQHLYHTLQDAYPIISLVGETSLCSAIGNDMGNELIFAQQVLGYGRERDILIAISTSGNSANVLNACHVAKIKGMTVIGLLNHNGGMIANVCDVAINAPATTTHLVQELHLPIYHAMCACVELKIIEDYL